MKLWQSIWARRLLLFRLGFMTAIAVVLAYTSFLLPSGIGEIHELASYFSLILVVSASVLLWAVASAVRQDWNTVFEPNCFFELSFEYEDALSSKTEQIITACARQKIPCRITETFSGGVRDTTIFASDSSTMMKCC